LLPYSHSRPTAGQGAPWLGGFDGHGELPPPLPLPLPDPLELPLEPLPELLPLEPPPELLPELPPLEPPELLPEPPPLEPPPELLPELPPLEPPPELLPELLPDPEPEPLPPSSGKLPVKAVPPHAHMVAKTMGRKIFELMADLSWARRKQWRYQGRSAGKCGDARAGVGALCRVRQGCHPEGDAERDEAGPSRCPSPRPTSAG
jgi:hypothetical protein